MRERFPSDPVPVADPRAFYLAYRGEIDRAVELALSSGSYILGPEVARFECEFASWLGVTGVVGCGNGTDALALALRLLGVGPGSTVVTVSHTAVATVASIGLVGATPLLLDIDPARYGMDWLELEEVLRAPPDDVSPIRAVILVHLYGHPADIDVIGPLCERYGVALIEDCAQAHGATLGGRIVGSFAPLAAFSFYPTKNLGALGDAGALACAGAESVLRAGALRQYGWRADAISSEAGINSRLDVLQAAILRVGLDHLDERNARRRHIAKSYDEALDNTPLQPPSRRDDVSHVFHQYVVRAAGRDAVRARLAELGVSTGIHYPVPVHLQPTYREAAILGPSRCRETERAAGEILSLPIFPELSEGDVDRVCSALVQVGRESR